jgi:hypothetical protein
MSLISSHVTQVAWIELATHHSLTSLRPLSKGQGGFDDSTCEESGVRGLLSSKERRKCLSSRCQAGMRCGVRTMRNQVQGRRVSKLTHYSAKRREVG